MVHKQHYSKAELIELGINAVGDNCLVSRKASLFGIERISLGDNVRIDDFCILSAGSEGIRLGNYIHIGAYSSLIGDSAIILEDYAGLSARVTIYSSSDDYSGEWMTNPTVDEAFTNVTSKPVYLGKHCIIGAGAIVLPGVTLKEGVAVGAQSLVTRSVDEFKIVAGSPARFVKSRSRALLEKEKAFKGQC
ncbi:acyltransferase [Pseudoalteromonas sp. S2755]|uniref:acyltransferase n=1 Tax=Pseudoalteromonas sp. S2755 TaxID=2066523 RepID=UPI00110C01F9|nr:acyltransferase [Pseudoalteromonas sp. S2755]TMN35996.1 galactoside O-acetyltransferase [Pseudoalteromonas sp. S2755]